MPRRNPHLDEFLSSAVHSGGQMMILISSMGQAIGLGGDMEADPEAIEGEIVEIVGRRLAELGELPDRAELQTAAKVLRWATASIGDELFGSRPDLPERSWIPEVRTRVRSLDDEPLPFDDEFIPVDGELLN